ncbi:tyrosine-protein phosphatase [Parabacteroides sp.]
MFIRIFSLFAYVTLLMGCSSNNPEIRALCLRDDIGNYILKWETEPQMEGILKMYVSDNPEMFNKSLPAGYANIKDGVTTYITNDNMSRKYFLLSFNDKYFKTVGARSVGMDSIQNVREIGGYETGHNHKATRWGKVYRSGQLSSLSEWDSIRLNNLHIKTIIDLRGNDELATYPLRYSNANIVHIPIPIKNIDNVITRIKEDRMRKGDGILFMQDTYLQYVTDYSEQYAKALDVFLDEDNYPILVNCSMGKDRTGYLTAMLLFALGIPEDTVIKDYMASNENINIVHLANMARDLSTNAQETITALVTVNEGLIDLVMKRIRKDYGSVDKYLSKGLHLTEKKQNKLKDILLY